MILALLGWGIHHVTDKNTKLSTTSKLAYVDGNDATLQVTDFYQQYIADSNKPDFQKNMVASYGDKNLVFYDEYYRHGFDPITCSKITPTKVTASLVSTGPVAHVKAVASYPDGTSAAIAVQVVLGSALSIDSITCPGTLGNLPPASN